MRFTGYLIATFLYCIRVNSRKILRSVSRGQTWIGVMFKSPVLGFCDSEVMSDEKKLSHASDQGDFGLLVVIALSLIHISEPTRLGMMSYAVFCLKKKKSSMRAL